MWSEFFPWPYTVNMYIVVRVLRCSVAPSFKGVIVVFPKISIDMSSDHQKLLWLTYMNFFFQGKRKSPCKTYSIFVCTGDFFHKSVFSCSFPPLPLFNMVFSLCNWKSVSVLHQGHPWTGHREGFPLAPVQHRCVVTLGWIPHL